MKIKIFSLLIASILVITLAGCGGKTEDQVKKIDVIQGENQCALANSEYSKKLIIELLGPKRPGLFGGKGSSYPVPKIKVKFEPAEGSDLKVYPETAVSNDGGAVSVQVFAGQKIGDQYLKVIPEGFPKATKTIRFVSGVTVEGAKQEVYAGHSLPNPIEVKIADSQGNAIQGVPVYFKITSSPEESKQKASCKPEEVRTNEFGVAECSFKGGEKTGTYTITAEIDGGKNHFTVRGLEIKEMVLDLQGLIIIVLGGLALFIFGMKLMSDGLQLVAGEKMKSILQFFARNRFIAVLAGTIVTAVIQSSSACTVMVVGFVNAGLLNLAQAIGIVFGANIGTTVTAQMISFKLEGLALPAIIFGLLITMLAKRTITRGWGQTLLGFGLLFFGMGMMGQELKLIGKFPAFIEFFNQFNCEPQGTFAMPIMPILGAIVIGTAMTLLIQSSSASMGIIIALAAGGLINFYTAVPLLLGTNIGTTITAILASLAANERAKQTAVAHVLFNVIGTVYMVLLFYVPFPGTEYPFFLYLVNMTTNGNALAPVPENLVRHIAMAHTLFNVFNVIIFLPFIGYIVKLCNIIIKVKDEKSIKLQYLEPHLLDTPSIALEQAIQSIRYMTKEAWSMIEKAMIDCVEKGKYDEAISEELMKREEKIDELQMDVTDYLVQVTKRELTEPQAEIIPLLMHCTNDAERIADHTENLIKIAKRLDSAKANISEIGKKEIKELWSVLVNQAENVIKCLNNTKNKNIDLALKDEKKINKLVANFEKSHLKRLRKAKCDPIIGMIFIELLNELERVGDHFYNIAERAPEIQKHHITLG
jgi:Na/Pi-cotransporter